MSTDTLDKQARGPGFGGWHHGMLAHRASFARYVKDITRFSKDCCLSVRTRLYRYVHTELLLRTKAL